MQDVTKVAVRRIIDAYYEQKAAHEKRQYIGRIRTVAKAVGVGTDTLALELEEHAVTKPPVKETLTFDAIKHTCNLLAEIKKHLTQTILNADRDLITRSFGEGKEYSVEICEGREPIPGYALRDVAAELLNICITAHRVDSTVKDGAIVWNWVVRDGSWANVERGLEIERLVRLKHARDQGAEGNKVHPERKKRSRLCANDT